MKSLLSVLFGLALVAGMAALQRTESKKWRKVVRASAQRPQ